MSNYVSKSDNLENPLKISRAILIIIVFILMIPYSSLILIWFISLSLLIAFCFLNSKICRKVIRIGDGISNMIVRLLFYFALVPIISLVCYGIICLIIALIFFNPGFSNPFFGLFLMIPSGVLCSIPFAQTLIVLILRYFTKK